MLTPRDVSALRRLQEAGAVSTPIPSDSLGDRGPVRAGRLDFGAPRRFAQDDGENDDRRPAGDWRHMFCRHDIWRDHAAAFSQARARWAAVWIDAAAAALAWQTRAMFPRPFS